jgi:hypothetical protein
MAIEKRYKNGKGGNGSHVSILDFLPRLKNYGGRGLISASFN